MEYPIVHIPGLAAPGPVNLLNTVVKLVDVAVRVIGIDVPVTPRHIPPHSLNANSLLLKEAGAIDYLGQRSGLPGNLVNGYFTLAATATASGHESIHHVAGKQHKGVMVAAVGEKVAAAVLNVRQFLPQPGNPLKVQNVRLPETQQVAVKVSRLFHVVGVESEVAQPANLERPVHHHAANAVFISRFRCGHSQLLYIDLLVYLPAPFRVCPCRR